MTSDHSDQGVLIFRTAFWPATRSQSAISNAAAAAPPNDQSNGAAAATNTSRHGTYPTHPRSRAGQPPGNGPPRAASRLAPRAVAPIPDLRKPAWVLGNRAPNRSAQGWHQWRRPLFAAAAAAPIHDQANGTALTHKTPWNLNDPPPSRAGRPPGNRRGRVPGADLPSCKASERLGALNRSDLGKQPKTPPETTSTRWLSSFFDAAAAAPIHDQANGTAADSQDTMEPKRPATEPSRQTARQQTCRVPGADLPSCKASERLGALNRSDLGKQPKRHPKREAPGGLAHHLTQQPRHRPTTKRTAPRLTHKTPWNLNDPPPSRAGRPPGNRRAACPGADLPSCKASGTTRGPLKSL